MFDHGEIITSLSHSGHVSKMVDILHEYIYQTKREFLEVQSQREKDLKQTLYLDPALPIDEID